MRQIRTADGGCAAQNPHCVNFSLNHIVTELTEDAPSDDAADAACGAPAARQGRTVPPPSILCFASGGQGEIARLVRAAHRQGDCWASSWPNASLNTSTRSAVGTRTRRRAS